MPPFVAKLVAIPSASITMLKVANAPDAINPSKEGPLGLPLYHPKNNGNQMPVNPTMFAISHQTENCKGCVFIEASGSVNAVIFIEQKCGPHIEQKWAGLA